MINKGDIYYYELKEGINHVVKPMKRTFIVLNDATKGLVKAVTVTDHPTSEVDNKRVYAEITINNNTKQNCILTDIVFVIPEEELKEKLGHVDPVVFDEIYSKAEHPSVIYDVRDMNGTFIRSIHLCNYKKYQDEIVSFDKKLNLIIGNNGSGKTTILSALATALSQVMFSMARIDLMPLNETDAHFSINRHGDTTFAIDYFYPVSVASTVHINGNTFLFEHVLAQDIIENQSFGKMPTKEVILNDNYRFPLFSYQRFDREWKLTPRKDSVTISTGLTNRLDGYMNCLDGQGYEEKIQKWCLKMSLTEFERKAEVREFRIFQRIIDHFMKIIEDGHKDYSVRYSTEFSELVYENGSSAIPLSSLSTGYKALLSMVMELAYRAVVLNPNIDESLNELEGIVLIDEIDAHLHPKWQWKVLKALIETFPSVQFIIATHSPIIISSAKDAHIIALDEEGINYIGSAYGYSVEDVLKFKQSSTDMPEESSSLSKRLDIAIDKGDMEEAGRIVNEARTEYGDDSAFYQSLYQYFSLNAVIEDME